MSAADLLAENLSLARACARQMRGRWESLDDLYADALVGLWQASERYDPERGVAFTTYAWQRMSGAINDGRRERDVLTRGQRKSGSVEAPVSLEAVLPWGDGLSLADLLADPVDEIEALSSDDDSWQAHVRLVGLISDLPPDDRYVVTRRLDGIMLADIGAEMGVTESRACQIHDRAIHRLRELVRESQPAAA